MKVDVYSHIVMTTFGENLKTLGSPYVRSRLHVASGRLHLWRRSRVLGLLLPLVLCVTLCSCSGKKGTNFGAQFSRTCEKLDVRASVAATLWHYKTNAGRDVQEEFRVVRAFCYRRQMARPKDAGVTDPLLTKASTKTLLGTPHAKDEDGRWLYYFNADHTWHLALEFRGETLFHTGYRQLNPEL